MKRIVDRKKSINSRQKTKSEREREKEMKKNGYIRKKWRKTLRNLKGGNRV